MTTMTVQTPNGEERRRVDHIDVDFRMGRARRVPDHHPDEAVHYDISGRCLVVPAPRPAWPFDLYPRTTR